MPIGYKLPCRVSNSWNLGKMEMNEVTKSHALNNSLVILIVSDSDLRRFCPSIHSSDHSFFGHRNNINHICIPKKHYWYWDSDIFPLRDESCCCENHAPSNQHIEHDDQSLLLFILTIHTLNIGNIISIPPRLGCKTYPQSKLKWCLLMQSTFYALMS